MDYVLDDTYRRCKEMEGVLDIELRNCVKAIYAPFTQEEISRKIVEMLTADGSINAEVDIIYQTLDGLREAIPDCPGAGISPAIIRRRVESVWSTVHISIFTKAIPINDETHHLSPSGWTFRNSDIVNDFILVNVCLRADVDQTFLCGYPCSVV